MTAEKKLFSTFLLFIGFFVNDIKLVVHSVRIQRNYIQFIEALNTCTILLKKRGLVLQGNPKSNLIKAIDTMLRIGNILSFLCSNL